jgi:hypothetical protein
MPTSAAPATSAAVAGSTGIPGVGQIVTGAGTSLTKPLAPTTKAFSRDCSTLADAGFYQYTCVTSSSPGGFIAAFIEGSKSSKEVRTLVYREVAGKFSLVLRDDTTDTGSTGSASLVKSDLNNDGDSKAVLVVPSANAMFAKTLDVIDTSGLVVIHLNLDGGFARAAVGGGLDAWFPSSAGGYKHDIIRYLSGQWTVISQDKESDTQAEPNNGGGFTP